jgi:hypothetical protein
MAAGLASDGAAIAENAADANGDAEPAARPAVEEAGLAQPDSKEPTDIAPNGNMGAAAINFSAERREGCKVFGMVLGFTEVDERTAFYRRNPI